MKQGSYVVRGDEWNHWEICFNIRKENENNPLAVQNSLSLAIQRWKPVPPDVENRVSPCFSVNPRGSMRFCVHVKRRLYELVAAVTRSLRTCQRVGAGVAGEILTPPPPGARTGDGDTRGKAIQLDRENIRACSACLSMPMELANDEQMPSAVSARGSNRTRRWW